MNDTTRDSKHNAPDRGIHRQRRCHRTPLCPVALLLNDAIEGDWTAYTGLYASYIFPSQENAIKFDEYTDSLIDEDDADMAEQLGGHRLVHEDRLRIWICDFDDGDDMYTCHIFAQGDGWLHMNRTGRNKQTEDVND